MADQTTHPDMNEDGTTLALYVYNWKDGSTERRLIAKQGLTEAQLNRISASNHYFRLLLDAATPPDPGAPIDA